VIAGEIGSGSLGYAAIGEQVGFAQRMEAVAPPGAAMLSESTARLVEHAVWLAEPEWVHIKGSDQPLRARRLMATGPRGGPVGRAEGDLPEAQEASTGWRICGPIKVRRCARSRCCGCARC
jgi:hypothetical protein